MPLTVLPPRPRPLGIPLPAALAALSLAMQIAAAVVALLFLAALCPAAAAQEGELDAVAREIAQSLELENVRSLLVGDIVRPKSDRTALGQELAAEIAAAIRRYAPFVRVLPLEQWLQTTAACLIDGDQVFDPDTAAWASAQADADGVLVGRIERRRGEFIVSLQLHFRDTLTKRRFLEFRLALTPERERQFDDRTRIHPPGYSGPKRLAVTAPGITGPRHAATQLSDPPAPARAGRVTGVVFVRVVVNEQGAVEHARVVRSRPSSLSCMAIEAVRDWRFEPARGPTGGPVAMEISVEVVFRPR